MERRYAWWALGYVAACLLPAYGAMLFAPRLSLGAGQVMVWAAVAYAAVGWLWLRRRVGPPVNPRTLASRLWAVGRALTFTALALGIGGTGAVLYDLAQDARSDPAQTVNLTTATVSSLLMALAGMSMFLLGVATLCLRLYRLAFSPPAPPPAP